ncbi:MAG: hypothetical protein IKN27_03120, partial [Selenomonadaceae bacterium]|nr:hypothetical protein [Selenomonadaceae bacterium]
TLLGAANEKLNIEKISNDVPPEGLSYNGDKTKLTAYTTFRHEQINLANYEPTVKEVNASSLVNEVNITGNALNNSIRGGKNSDTLDGGDGDDTLKGEKGNDTIYGGDGDDKIDGGKGTDWIYGGKGNDSLKGGDDVDLFVYVLGDGNDTIDDFKDTDLIQFVDAEVSKTQIVGSNVVFTFNDGGTLTVKKGKGKKFTVLDANGEHIYDSTVIKSSSSNDPKLLVLDNSHKSTVTLDFPLITADASARTKKIEITGNVLDNVLIGGTKNDTLNGGMGNDVLTGGKGNDVFIYDGGNDTITDYGTGDKISLNASVKSFGASGKDFVFKFNDGSLTLANAASQKISVTSGKVTSVYSADGISNTAGTAVTLNASAKTFTADSKIVTINAGLTSGATVTGNSKANKIWLGDGSDVVIWSKGGNDTLMNFGSDDLLSITGAVSDASVKSGNTYLKIGSKKITVKDSSQVTFADDNGIRIFDNGIFYNADETSATIPASFKSNTKTPLELGAKEIDGS